MTESPPGFVKRPATASVPLAVKVLAVLVPLFVVYWQDLLTVKDIALTSEAFNYVLVIPVFVAYALVRRRRNLQVLASFEDPKGGGSFTTSNILGIVVLLSAFLIYFYGSYTSYALEYHMLSMPIFVAGAILLVFNHQTLRALAFPIAILALVQPFQLDLASQLGSGLSMLSTMLGYHLSRLVNIPVSLASDPEGLPMLSVRNIQGSDVLLAVREASSGLYSLTGFSVFGAFAAYITTGWLPKRVGMFMLGLPIVYALNIFRITTLIAIAHQWGAGLALEVFHTFGGMTLVFLATLLILAVGTGVWKVRITPPTTKTKPQPCLCCKQSEKDGESFCLYCGRLLGQLKSRLTRRYSLKLLALTLIVVAVMLAQASTTVLARSPTEVDLKSNSGEELQTLLPTIPGYDLRYIGRDTRVERILSQDAALIFAYVPEKSTGSTGGTIYAATQIAKYAHRWEASLVIYPTKHGRPTADIIMGKDVAILQEPPIVGRFLVFQRPNSKTTEAVLYWVEPTLFKIGQNWETKRVQISLWATTDDLQRRGMITATDDFLAVEGIFMPIAQRIAEYWQPVKTYTLAKVGFNQVPFLPLTAALAGILLLREAVKNWGRSVRNTKTYRRLSIQEEKDILKAVTSAAQQEKPVGKSIAAIYGDHAGKTVTPERLVEVLKNAEKAGLTYRCLDVDGDELSLVWRSRGSFT